MRIKTTKTKVYGFEELSQKAKDKAINDHINFLMKVTQYEEASDNYKKALDKAEAEYIWKYCKDEILQSIEMNHYEFNENGNIA
jgi:hypothetical protein